MLSGFRLLIRRPCKKRAHFGLHWASLCSRLVLKGSSCVQVQLHANQISMLHHVTVTDCQPNSTNNVTSADMYWVRTQFFFLENIDKTTKQIETTWNTNHFSSRNWTLNRNHGTLKLAITVEPPAKTTNLACVHQSVRSLPSYWLGKLLTASVLNISKVHMTWCFPIPRCHSRLPHQEAWLMTAKMFISTLHSLPTKCPGSQNRHHPKVECIPCLESLATWVHQTIQWLLAGKCNRCKQYQQLSHASLSPRSHILIEKTHSKNMTRPQQFPMVFQHFSSWLGLWLGSRPICRTEPNLVFSICFLNPSFRVQTPSLQSA